MSTASIDSRGRITIPKNTRDRLKAHIYIASLEDDGLRLTPVPDPRKSKASIPILWTIEELVETQERHLLSQA